MASFNGEDKRRHLRVDRALAMQFRLKKYKQKMKGTPPYSITDQGYRSKANFKAAGHIDTAYFGKSCDVPAEKQKFANRLPDQPDQSARRPLVWFPP